MPNLAIFIKRHSPSWVYRILSRMRFCFSPEITFYISPKSRIYCNSHSYVERLISQGIYETTRRNYLSSLFASNVTFIDVGANIGFYTLLAAESLDSVMAFEPDPINYHRLCQNIRLNGYTAIIKASQVALGNSNCVASLSRPLTDNFGMASLLPLSNSDSINIDMVKLDDFWLPNLYYPTVIKIDVEGFEAEVLAGSSLTMSKLVVGSKWIVEIHVGAGILVDSIVNLFDPALYKIEFLCDASGELVSKPPSGIDVWLVVTRI